MIHTIKGKIVLWYSITVIAIVCTGSMILQITTAKLTDAIILERLKNAMDIVQVSTIYREDFKENLKDNFSDEVQIMLFDLNGEYIQGEVTEAVKNLPLKDKGFKKININNKVYYVNDELVTSKEGEQYWIRAYLVFTNKIMWDKSLMDAIVYLTPLFLLSAILGGIFIAKRAFDPISRIRLTVKEITASGDLNRRIVLNKKDRDELSLLADTFNEMFDEIQNILMKEKQMTSDTSHELRTPVTVILAQGEYLLEQLQELNTTHANQEMIATTEIIIRQTQHLQKIINDLLMIARMENKKTIFEKDNVDFSEILEMIVEEMQEVADRHKILIKCNVPECLFLKINETLLIRVLMNLISNAVKYGRENGWVRVTAYEEENQIICTVEDNGIGIADEDIEKIWMRFYRVDKSRRYEDDSTGLGLFLVKHIVERMDGKITVKSKLDEGACFTLYMKK